MLLKKKMEENEITIDEELLFQDFDDINYNLKEEDSSDVDLNLDLGY